MPVVNFMWGSIVTIQDVSRAAHGIGELPEMADLRRTVKGKIRRANGKENTTRTR